MDIKIIYEDEFLIAINKPSGIMAHPDGRSKEPSVSGWVIKNYPEIQEAGEPMILHGGKEIKRPGIVHRLDKETSGVMLIAKTKESFEYLKQKFQRGEIKKTYRALAYGHIKNDTGIIDKPIGKSKSDFRKRSAEYGARGALREAVTEYKVLTRGLIESRGSSCRSLTSTDAVEVRLLQDFLKVTYLEAYPKTGRTHQIRVHLKSIGHPVVCDKLYAESKPCPPELGRLALHAFSISFTTQTKKELLFEAELSDDFQKTLASLK